MIRVLEKNIADKIAAGEVIDRPVSIVKELLENSIDAGADAVTVEISRGGKSYIRVTDNGCGIEKDDAEIAFRRHATSKIESARDLDAVETLGFRGEALASICAVSRVEMITRTKEARAGRRIAAEGSEILENIPAGCPEGTTVTVRDLFYNVPARRKFLSSDNSEARRITDMVSRIAMAYPNIRISFINNGKKVFVTQGKGNLLRNIISVYGSDLGRDLLPVHMKRDDFTVEGFVSIPAASAPSRSRQIFCVNGRIISSRVMEAGLEEAYREKLFTGRFPAGFIFLSMPPEKTDVNIHPTKKEIRFDDSLQVEEVIRDAVRMALERKEALPQVKAESIRRPDEKPYTAEDRPSKAPSESEWKDKGEQVDIKNILSNMRREEEYRSHVEEEKLSKLEEELRPERAPSRPFDFENLKYMGIIFRTYILAVDESCFYLIDQHAAHERVFYEKLLSQYNASEKSSQQLLTPMSFDVAAYVAEDEDKWIGELLKMGYEIESFGERTYIVRAVPAFMGTGEAEDFLRDVFSQLEDRRDLSDRKSLERLITRSCRSAVKGGDSLKEEETAALIRDLKACVNPFSCPHGRPTFIRMTRYEIEKMFKRV
ncbi:MAG TPA: DNA mismatch repair endonuclease MutL [Candidatus Copromorpha excrementigallinarum]|uniref:DNA mismatch repair protein MutL n=1 Tax=Candidatus Allocopromorpha excrementigallinarum TaxID=2840742 RepID=A0A9D1I3Z4_9FIRM|nr:DNA mismatch repair endonuclease MutL [Candidatus Copromorpha excrementigallinarum]